MIGRLSSSISFGHGKCFEEFSGEGFLIINTTMEEQVSVRAEKALREAVQFCLSKNNISSRIFCQMSRPERKYMYEQYKLTEGRDLFAPNRSDLFDVYTGASAFSSWLEIKTSLFQMQGITISEADAETKNQFMKWLREQSGVSSLCRSPGEKNSKCCTELTEKVITTIIDDNKVKYRLN